MKIVFYLIGTWTIVSAMLAITMRNLVHCALALIAFFAGIAAIFFSLHADFLGAVQIVVYVGAIAILLLFAIMLTRNITGDEASTPFSPGAIWGCLASLIILGILIYTLPKSLPLLSVSKSSPDLTVSEIGQDLMTRFVIPFEMISLLLTAVLVGAVVIALEEPKEKEIPESKKQ